MRETHPVRIETSRERMKRIKRNVQIRKEKLYGVQFSSQESTISEHKQVKEFCKEDKYHQQKLKNRQAAQKSREQKKMYTSHLEEEIKRLKNIMGGCQQCKHKIKQFFEAENTKKDSDQRIFKDTDLIVDSTVENMVAEDNHIFQMNSNLDIRNSDSLQFNEVQLMGESTNDDSLPESESRFYRSRSNSEDSSIGMFLFLFMIIIGVFCIGVRFDSSDSAISHRRDLLQNFQSKNRSEESQIQSINFFETSRNPKYSTHIKDNVESSKDQNGLVSIDRITSNLPISLDRIIFNKIIENFEDQKVRYNDKNLRSKNAQIDQHKSLLYCSSPKLYKSAPNDQGMMTTFLDIFVQGIEIVNFLSPGDSQSQSLGSLQLNGLYKITASVEEIEAIPNHNSVY